MPKQVDEAQIFRAVMQEVLAKGYDGATTRAMARAAGVSEVTLFRRYGSKAGLVRRAVEFLAEQMRFEEVVAYTGDVEADLVRVVRRYQQLVAEYGDFLAVLIPEFRRHHELTPALAQPMAVMGRLAALLARYQEEGVLRPESPWHAVAGLLGPLVYFAMARGTLFEPPLPPLEAEEHVRRFLEGRRVK